MPDPVGVGPRPPSPHTQRAYATDWQAFAAWRAAGWRRSPISTAAVLDEAALRALLASCGEDLAGQRDRALFLLAQASGLRRRPGGARP